MKKIDLHLHLSFDPVPKSDTLLVSTYKEMLPHLEELGIGKGVLMSSGERNFSMPMGSNEENCRIAAADPEHYAWMCNLDYDGNSEIPKLFMTGCLSAKKKALSASGN